jgi:ABC-type uncharacterized transport system substrate-binding protein
VRRRRSGCGRLIIGVLELDPRRDFITLIGSTAAWPFAASSQQPERMRVIGILLGIAKDDPDYQPWISAFRQALQELGWIEGRNVRMDIRWATADPGEIRKQAAELAASAPDVILAPGTTTVGPLMQATRTVPIVFPTQSPAASQHAHRSCPIRRHSGGGPNASGGGQRV